MLNIPSENVLICIWTALNFSYIRRLNWSNGNKEDQIEEFDSLQELSEEETNCIHETVHGAENSCTLSSNEKEGHNDTDMKGNSKNVYN